jgi:hypothetical protein
MLVRCPGEVMNRREHCIAHTQSVVGGTHQRRTFSSGMIVEYHGDCSIHDQQCDYSTVQLLREDHRGDGWWIAKFGDRSESLVHEQELLETVR